MFRVLVKTDVWNVPEADPALWWFKKTVTLPFPPFPGLWLRELGLVERVVWSVQDKEFTVYLPTIHSPCSTPEWVSETLVELGRQGWVQV